MKEIYLGESAQKIKDVYCTEDTVYCKADILKAPEDFRDTEYIFSTWGMPEFTEEEIGTYLPRLKAIFYGAGTVQYFARPFLNYGVKVFSAWAANAVPVAEYTVAQIILANKGFFAASGPCSIGNRSEAGRRFSAFPGNYGETVGIIGAGMVGKLVIKLLKNYHLQVLVFDPFLPDETAKALGVTKCTLPELFEKSFVISNHLANNPQTRGMLNYELFSKMRPDSVFINTGRGAQVVEPDLIKLLRARPDITAILDVTDPEPPEKDSAFYKLPNCILTPHIAGSSGREVQRMGEYMKQEYRHFIQNEPCKYEVTLDMLKTMA